MKSYFNALTPGLLLVVFFITAPMAVAQYQQQAPAQQQRQQQPKEASDQELKKYANASSQISDLNQKAQQKMVNAVQEEGLKVQEYNQIQQKSQQGKNDNIKEKEMQKYMNAQENVQEVQMNMQQESQEIIQSNGMTVQRYEEITMLVRQNPELQNKVENMK